MFDAADLDAFVDPSMPGYVLATIDGQLVGGLFRERYAESFSIVCGTQTSFKVRATGSVAEGAVVVIGGRAFTVAAVEVAEPGFTTLKLEAA